MDSGRMALLLNGDTLRASENAGGISILALHAFSSARPAFSKYRVPRCIFKFDSLATSGSVCFFPPPRKLSNWCSWRRHLVIGNFKRKLEYSATTACRIFKCI